MPHATATAPPLHADRGCAAARACIAAGQWAQAVDLVACTALIDLQKYQGAFLSSAAAACRLTDLYAQAFAGTGLAPRTVPSRAPGPRTRILFVTFQVCEGQAAAVS